MLNKLVGVTSVITILATAGVSYYEGFSAGSSRVQLEWNLEKDKTNAYINTLKDTYASQNEKYQKDTNDLLNQLAEKDKEHAVYVSQLNASFDSRLRKSEQRASAYKRMSCSTENNSSNLADYTARYDRVITEGIDLVRELRATLELRDNQLKQLGLQLKNLGVTDGNSAETK